MRTCSVAACNSVHYGKGLCEMHYGRLRRTGTTDDPIRTPRGEPLRFVKQVILKHTDKDACLIWPYSRNEQGYARLQFRGKTTGVCRLVCRKVNGEPPTPQHEARHTCGKGHNGCVNVHHLTWGTPKENQRDRTLHGTDNRGERCGNASLTEADVHKIRRLIKKDWSDRKIADKFDVTRHAISSIRRGRTWTHI